jgi:hypothetical protein
MATLSSLTVNDTGFLQIPTGNVTQRPASPLVGQTRFNNIKNEIEFYNGSTWSNANIQPASVITSGLVRHYDARNITSYPGSGSVWTDLSNNSNATLVNSPTFNTNNGGYFTFNGTNQTAGVGSLSLTNNWSISAWCRPTATHEIDAQSTTGAAGVSGQRYLISSTLFNEPAAGAGISVGTNGVSIYEHSQGYMPPLIVLAANFLSTQWIQVTLVYRSKRPFLYINGVLVSIGPVSPRTGDIFASPTIGGMNYGHFQGDIGQVMYYNRSLTDLEVYTNYQATRARFGTTVDLALGRTQQTAAASALAIKASNPTATSGIYWIRPPGNPTPQRVYCDMETDGGGWMLIARTHPSGTATAWGWKGATFGAVDDFTQPYNAGWGTQWHNFNSTFSQFIMGNRRNVLTNQWGPFIYKTDVDYNTLFTVDGALVLGTRLALRTNTGVWNQTNYPVMQYIIGWADTGNNVVYFMRDATGYTGTAYGITPSGMGTTYCNSTTVLGYSGPWCAGSAVDPANDFVQKGTNQDYGGTNQCMLMVR